MSDLSVVAEKSSRGSDVGLIIRADWQLYCDLFQTLFYAYDCSKAY